MCRGFIILGTTCLICYVADKNPSSPLPAKGSIGGRRLVVADHNDGFQWGGGTHTCYESIDAARRVLGLNDEDLSRLNALVDHVPAGQNPSIVGVIFERVPLVHDQRYPLANGAAVVGSKVGF